MTDEQKEFYNLSAEYFATLSNQKIDYFLPFLNYVSLYAKPGDKLLDLGCGTGQSSDLLKKRGFKVTGTDGCEKYIRQAQKTFPENEYIFSQAEISPFPNDSFDCVASYNTIEHLVDLPKVLAEIARILKPGGVFIIHSPNLLSIQHPINALRKFKGMTFEGNKNLFQLMFMMIRNINFLLLRRIIRRPRIIYRKIPKIFDFPDSDASWLMNPLDMRSLLLESGFKIVKYQNLDSLAKKPFIKSAASLIIPEQMGIIRIVALIEKS